MDITILETRTKIMVTMPEGFGSTNQVFIIKTNRKLKTLLKV
jgi:hypothetical protein